MVEIGETRFIMGICPCVVTIKYREGVRMRNVEVELFEDYKFMKKGEYRTMPVRKLWIKKRGDIT